MSVYRTIGPLVLFRDQDFGSGLTGPSHCLPVILYIVFMKSLFGTCFPGCPPVEKTLNSLTVWPNFDLSSSMW